MKLILLTCALLYFNACKSADYKSASNQQTDTTEVEEPSVKVGAERTEEYIALLKNKRVALVVNQTSVIGKTHLVDSLKSLGINLVKVFAPEHGFRGDHSDGASIKSGKDEKSGLLVQSLYGSTKKPSPEMLAEVDVVLFDIQDVGVRFYTFISTMHYVMEACAENHKEMLVLDRPNPNGFYIDGPVLNLKYQSFIGMHQIPLVHGLTVGELALMINGESWLKNKVVCDLQVITCENYDHNVLYNLPIAPSPNLPNMNAVYLYPSLGLFEGTNVSVGRGTDNPFQIVGRPGYEGKMQGYDGLLKFTPRSIPGVSDNPKYVGEQCSGYMIKEGVNGSIFFDKKLFLDYLIEFYRTNRTEDGSYFRDFFHKLSGTDKLRTQIESGMNAEKIRQSWATDLEEYKLLRKKYLLYL